MLKSPVRKIFIEYPAQQNMQKEKITELLKKLRTELEIRNFSPKTNKSYINVGREGRIIEI